MKNIFIVLFLLLLFNQSCEKETETFELGGQEYAAEKIGRVRLYKVDSQVFNFNTAFDTNYTVTFWERHITREIQIDSAGYPFYYHQVFRTVDKIDYIPSYSYRTYIDSINFSKVYNNKRVIHLWLPINSFKSWDGNIYNSEKGGQKFRYINQDDLIKPDSIFKDQITVRLKKEILPLTESYAEFETYAPNIGMVHKYKYFNDIQKKQNNTISQSGYHLNYNLESYK